MANVRVVTDSCCDLPASLVERYGVPIVPLTVRFGDEELLDSGDLSPSEFWRRCARSPTLPTTAAPSPAAFEEVFRSLAEDDGVVYVSISSTFSATWQSAQAAARAMADIVAVRVIDSRSTSLGLGMVALHAARKAAEGAEIDEVVAVAESAAGRTKLVVTLGTLENLRKGGRIGAAEALGGSILAIKPVIEVRDGVVAPGPKQRTRSRAMSFLVDTVAAEADASEIGVMHSMAPDLEEFLGLLTDLVPREKIVVGDIGAAIGTHTGAGAIGVTYQMR